MRGLNFCRRLEENSACKWPLAVEKTREGRVCCCDWRKDLSGGPEGSKTRISCTAESRKGPTGKEIFPGNTGRKNKKSLHLERRKVKAGERAISSKKPQKRAGKRKNSGGLHCGSC